MRILILLFLFISSSVFAQETSSKEIIKNLKNGAAIVRLYMNKPKVDFLKKAIDSDKVSEKDKAAFKKNLEYHLKDRETYKSKVIKTFSQYYDFSKLYFIHDYDAKKLIEGTKDGIFLNQNGEVDPSITLTESHSFIFGRGNNDKTVILSNIDGSSLPKDFPVTHNRSLAGILDLILGKDKFKIHIEEINKGLYSFEKKLYSSKK
jgi:hypothetical protein